MYYDADVIVIGSGFGGSVCALRAAEAGLRTLVLERGPRVDANLLEQIAAARSPIWHRRGSPGIAELHLRSGLAALTASGVGGGSNIYTAVTVPAPAEAFTEAWPAELRADRLAQHYQTVADVIRPVPLQATPPRTTVMNAMAGQLGASFVRLPLAIEENTDASRWSETPVVEGMRRELAIWLAGGRATRKRTLSETYLAQATRAGAIIRPLHDVRRCIREREGFRLVLRRLSDGEVWVEDTLAARRVVLAAGTLSSVRLLLKWRDVHGSLPRLSPSIGRRFFQNGDSAGLLLGPLVPMPRDPGPPVTAWLDYWKTDRLFLMDAGVWPTGGSITGSGSRYGTAWAIATMGFDEAAGRLHLSRRGRLVHEFDPAAAQPFAQRRLHRLRELADAVGARLLVPPASLMRRFPTTVHPLGGACMASRAELGAVDAGGEAFGCEGLFVADGSVLPTPTGAAPSMTIAAVAEHVARRVVASCRT